MPRNASSTLKACEDYGCAPSAAGPCPCWWRWSWTGDSGHGHNPGGSRKWHLASHKCTRRVCLATEAFCMCFHWTCMHFFYRTTEPFGYASMLSCTVLKMAETCLINGQLGPTANPSYVLRVQTCFLLMHTCKKQKGNMVICTVVN